MNKINLATKPAPTIHVRLTQFSDRDIDQLKQLALEKTGSSSLSTFSRYLLKQSLGRKKTTVSDAENQEFLKGDRLTLRVPSSLKKKLIAMAKKEDLSINKYAVLHLYRVAFSKLYLTPESIQTLYDTNYQLYQIGKNINQIAYALNAHQTFSVNTDLLKETKALIDHSVNVVHDYIKKHQLKPDKNK